MYTNQMLPAEIEVKKQLLSKYRFSEPEQAEIHSGFSEPTGFPKPLHFYRLMVEAINLPVEEAYFWILDELRDGFSFNKSIKISDIAAAAESSSFFGVLEQRLGMQQDKAAQYLKGISEMIKSLFQIVREIRIIDERMGYYNHTFNRPNAGPGKDDETAGSEISLKGIWVDQVEGGTKNAASVYGLSQTVGFTVLPDLFFRVRADDRGLNKISEKEGFDQAVKKIVENVNATVNAISGFNDKVKEVLNRKLNQYYVWKLRTFKELQTRRTFTLKYLRQHYDTVKLYMGWVKPYLRNIQRLQMAEKLVKKEMADMISAFEGALVEIETLSYKETGSKWKPVVLIYMFYRTRPALSYVQEGYQRGPMHTGRFDLILRSYVWNNTQIENYVNMREAEDLQLLGSVDDSIKTALDSLGDELKGYLKESGENFEEDEAEAEKKKKEEEEKARSPLGKDIIEPFTGVFKGVKEIFEPLTQGLDSFKKVKDSAPLKKISGDPDHGNIVGQSIEIEQARAAAKAAAYGAYKNYKKMHGMMTFG